MSLIDCINEWLKEHPITGCEIKEHPIDRYRFDVFIKSSLNKDGIIILDRSYDPSRSRIYVYSTIDHSVGPILFAMIHIDNEIVEFELYDKLPCELSNIMSSANPLFFDWMRNWLKVVIYGMGTVRKTQSS